MRAQKDVSETPVVFETFTLLAEDMQWSSAGHVPLALIGISAAELSGHLGVKCLLGVEEGRGAWCALRLRLRSGAQVELIDYAQAPERGFLVRADRGSAYGALLEELLAAISVSRKRLLWVSDAAQRH